MSSAGKASNDPVEEQGDITSAGRALSRVAVVTLILLFLSGCAPFESIPYSPPQTPESWLQIQPTARVAVGGAEVIIVQPSTSAIVYLLGLVTLGVGVWFLRSHRQQRARTWWGVALLLWGAG
ncbi:MAG: hypothetical protein JW963_26045, partial [Anaerolineales bacterium]|nr:hypothetical protein [Anaerolineales bacterium]